MKKVLLVGVGLIGGSFSLGLQQHGGFMFGGYSRRKATLEKAQELGIIETMFDSLEEGVAWADWVILSIPVDVIKKLLPGILDLVNESQLVIDFGSTKGAICEEVGGHPRRAQFLAGHPIAGTEYSGPEAAFADLFKDKNLMLCEGALTNQSLKHDFEAAAKSIGFSIVEMGAEEHDRHLAYISHLSHITSFSLSNTVLEKEKDGEVILELAGSGFASTVRLAKSSPEMWTPIFQENKKMLLESIDSYMAQVQRMRAAIADDDTEAIRQLLEDGREIKRILG